MDTMGSTFNSPGFLDLIRRGAIRRNDDDYNDRHENLPANVDPETRGGNGTDAGSPLNVGSLPTNNRLSADDLMQMAPPAPTVNSFRAPTGPLPTNDRLSADDLMRMAPPASPSQSPGVSTQPDNLPDGSDPRSPLDVSIPPPPAVDTSSVRQLDQNRVSTGMFRPNESAYKSGVDQAGNTIGRGRGFFAGFVRGMQGGGGAIGGLMNGIAGLVDPNYGREQVFQRDNAKFTAQKQQDLAELNEDPVQKMQRDYAQQTALNVQETARQFGLANMSHQTAIDIAKLNAQTKVQLQEDKYRHLKDINDDKSDTAVALKQMVINAMVRKEPEAAAMFIAYRNGHKEITDADRALAGEIHNEYLQSEIDKNNRAGQTKPVTNTALFNDEMKSFHATENDIRKQMANIRNSNEKTDAMKAREIAPLQTQLDKATATTSQKRAELQKKYNFTDAQVKEAESATAAPSPGKRMKGTARRGSPSSKNLNPGDLQGWAKQQGITDPEEAKRRATKAGYVLTP